MKETSPGVETRGAKISAAGDAVGLDESHAATWPRQVPHEAHALHRRPVLMREA